MRKRYTGPINSGSGIVDTAAYAAAPSPAERTVAGATGQVDLQACGRRPSHQIFADLGQKGETSARIAGERNSAHHAPPVQALRCITGVEQRVKGALAGPEDGILEIGANPFAVDPGVLGCHRGDEAVGQEGNL